MLFSLDWVGRLFLVVGVGLSGAWYLWVFFLYDPRILAAKRTRAARLTLGLEELMTALRIESGGRSCRLVRLTRLRSADPEVLTLLVVQILSGKPVAGCVKRFMTNSTPLVPLFISGHGGQQAGKWVMADLVVLPIRGHLRLSGRVVSAPLRWRLVVHTGQMTTSRHQQLLQGGVYNLPGCRLDSLLVSFLNQ